MWASDEGIRQEYPEGSAGSMTYQYKWALMPPLDAEGRCTQCKEPVSLLVTPDAKRLRDQRCRCRPGRKGRVFRVDTEEKP